MQDQHNIEELFRESFQNFEEPVKPELWNQIADKIGVSAPSPVADAPVHAVETVATGAKITGTVATWISAAAITVSGIVGYFVYDSLKSTPAPAEIHQPVSEDNTSSTDVSISENTSSNSEQKSENENVEISKNLQTINASANQQPSASSKNEKSTSLTHNGVLSVEHDEEKAPSLNDKSADHSNVNAGTPAQNTNSTSALSDSDIKIPKPNVQPSIGYAPLEVNFSVSGDVQKAEWDLGSGIVESKTAPFSHIFDQPGIHTITLKTTDIKGNIKSEVINIEVIEDMNIKGISNVFTPNFDGSNDRFTFNRGNLTDIEVTIYDKGGKIIYKFTDPESGWDGKFSSGDDVPEGTYFYVIFATGSGQRKHQQGGTVTIIR